MNFIEQEIAYAPRLSKDRLVLGLRGSLNKHNLDLRQHSVGSVRRGASSQTDPGGAHWLHPDRRLKRAVSMTTQVCGRCGGASPAPRPCHILDRRNLTGWIGGSRLLGLAHRPKHRPARSILLLSGSPGTSTLTPRPVTRIFSGRSPTRTCQHNLCS